MAEGRVFLSSLSDHRPRDERLRNPARSPVGSRERRSGCLLLSACADRMVPRSGMDVEGGGAGLGSFNVALLLAAMYAPECPDLLTVSAR